MLRQIDAGALAQAVRRAVPALGEAQCRAWAQRLVEETDPRLEENVRQWMEGEPLSDVWIGSYCVGMVMKIQGRNDFLSALEAMNRYTADPAAGARVIWRSVR